MKAEEMSGIKEADVNAGNEQRQDTFIGESHPRDGREWDAQCARCGSSLDWHQCDVCGGEGITGLGELYEEDPLWYDMYDYKACHQCGGQASWPYCISSPDWCEAHPLRGREKTKSGTPEWFVIRREASRPKAADSVQKRNEKI